MEMTCFDGSTGPHQNEHSYKQASSRNQRTVYMISFYSRPHTQRAMTVRLTSNSLLRKLGVEQIYGCKGTQKVGRVGLIRLGSRLPGESIVESLSPLTI